MSEPSSKQSTPPPSRWQQTRVILGWVLAPVLATGAVILQIQLDVPTGEFIPRTGKKKAKPPPPSQRRKDRSRNLRSDWEPRSAERLAILHESWEHQDIEDEPIDQGFRRHHEALVRTAVSLARRETIGSELIALRAKPICHSIRCELEMCGPAEPIDTVAAALPEVRRRKEPLWQLMREVEPKRTPQEAGVQPNAKLKPSEGPESDDPKAVENKCRRWILSFVSDDVARHELRFGDAPDDDDDDDDDDGGKLKPQPPKSPTPPTPKGPKGPKLPQGPKDPTGKGK